MVLIFETEVTDSLSWGDWSTSSLNTLRLIEIAWIKYTDEGELIAEFGSTIYPNNFKIHKESYIVHGKTEEFLKEKGNDVNQILNKFSCALNDASIIVGHNIQSLIAVIKNEFAREKIVFDLSKKTLVCTMESGVKYGDPKNKYRTKFLVLQDLYNCMFGLKWKKSHSAADNVKLISKCFWYMSQTRVVVSTHNKPLYTITMSKRIIIDEYRDLIIKNDFGTTVFIVFQNEIGETIIPMIEKYQDQYLEESGNVLSITLQCYRSWTNHLTNYMREVKNGDLIWMATPRF